MPIRRPSRLAFQPIGHSAFRNTGPGILTAGLAIMLLLSGCSTRVRPQAPQNNILPEQSRQNQSGPEASSPTEGAQPQWFSCKQDSDCVVEKGLCDEPAGINKAFLDAYRSFRDRWNPALDCVTHVEWRGDYQTRCVQHRCTPPLGTKTGTTGQP